MPYKCNECDSDSIAWDAWVDEDGNIVGGPYDNCQCMECGSEDVDEYEEEPNV